MAGRFQTTKWTLVLQAGRGDDADARVALEGLCEAYWYPLYEFVRRQGHSADESADLVQGYFALLLEKGFLDKADPERGRFRSFLLTSLKHYLYNEYDKARRLKRGGDVRHVSIDAELADKRFSVEPSDSRTPEDAYARRWALVVIDRVLDALEAEQTTDEQRKRFEQLKGHLTDSGPQAPYADIAAELGVSEAVVRVSVHRLRGRFGALLREEIGNTVSNPEEVEAEIRYLIDALTSQKAT